jgi:hypothetical protein
MKYNGALKMKGILKAHFKLEHMPPCSVRQLTGSTGQIIMWICKWVTQATKKHISSVSAVDRELRSQAYNCNYNHVQSLFFQ